jgi:hypothetical protein
MAFKLVVYRRRAVMFAGQKMEDHQQPIFRRATEKLDHEGQDRLAHQWIEAALTRLMPFITIHYPRVLLQGDIRTLPPCASLQPPHQWLVEVWF